MAVSTDPAWSNVVFVASGRNVFALSVAEPHLDGNASFDSSRGADPPPFTSEDEVGVDCTVVCSVDTTGEVRGLSVCCGHVLFTDNNGLVAAELPPAPPEPSIKLKPKKLAGSTRQLSDSHGVEHTKTTGLFTSTLSSADGASRKLHNCVICIVNSGCLYVVGCQSSSACSLEIKVDGCITPSAAYHAASHTVFLAGNDGNAIFSGKLDLVASFSAVLRSGAEAKASSKGRPSAGSKTVVTLPVVQSFSWTTLASTHHTASPLLMDVCVSHSGAVYGCKSGSGIESVVSVFGRRPVPSHSGFPQQTPAVLRARTIDVSPISSTGPVLSFDDAPATTYLPNLSTIARKSFARCTNTDCMQRIITIAKYCEEARYWKVSRAPRTI